MFLKYIIQALKIYLQMEFEECTKPSSITATIDHVDSPPIAGNPPPANHLPTPPR